MAGSSEGGGCGGARRVRSMWDGPDLRAWWVGGFFGICAIGAVAYVAAGGGSPVAGDGAAAVAAGGGPR